MKKEDEAVLRKRLERIRYFAEHVNSDMYDDRCAVDGIILTIDDMLHEMETEEA